MKLGIALALLMALLKGVQSIYQRRNALDTDEFITAFSSRIFGAPILLLAMGIYGVPDLTPRFLLLAVPQSAVIAGTSILIAKAYKASDASIVTPMFAVSPILVLFTSFIMLGELPDLLGIVGVVLIAAGAYILKIKNTKSILEPLKKLWHERGVQIILIVIAIYSVTANIDKIGVGMTSPVMWPLTVYTLSSMIMLPVMMKKSPDWKGQIVGDWKPLALLGGLGGITILLQMMALELTLVSYVISIKRLSIPVTVILSYYLLNEKESFAERILGSALMALGVILISI